MRKIALLAALSVLIGVAGAAIFVLRDARPSILLSDAFASIRMTDGTPAVAISLKIANEGAPDRLLSAEAPGAKLVMLHGEEGLTGLPIPAGGSPSLAMDGAHVMLMGVEGDLTEGRLFPVTLAFERAGELTTKATLRETMAMDHGAEIDLPADDAPAIALSVEPAGEGWRIRAETERFRFAPENMDGPHQLGEGHGHLYIGGLKIMRMLSPEVEIGALPPGPHKMRVTLNANDHRAYFADGEPVSATAEIAAD